MDLHAILEALGGLSVIGIGLAIWKASSSFTAMTKDISSMASDVNSIMSNHLPHLEQKIDSMNDKFIAHLEGHN